MAWIAVKNDSHIPCISVYADDKRTFSDILRGSMSEYVFFPYESVYITVYDNFEKPVFDDVLSVHPYKKQVISVGNGTVGVASAHLCRYNIVGKNKTF